MNSYQDYQYGFPFSVNACTVHFCTSQDGGTAPQYEKKVHASCFGQKCDTRSNLCFISV